MGSALFNTSSYERKQLSLKKKPTVDFLPGGENKDNVIFQQELIVFCLFLLPE